jgi:transposase-like protein
MSAKRDKGFVQRVGELSRTHTVYQAAEATGKSDSTLYAIAREHGIHFQTRNRRRYTPQHHQQTFNRHPRLSDDLMTEIAEAKAEMPTSPPYRSWR